MQPGPGELVLTHTVGPLVLIIAESTRMAYPPVEREPRAATISISFAKSTLGRAGVGVMPRQIEVHTVCHVASSRTTSRADSPMPLQHVSGYGFVLRRVRGMRVPVAASLREPPQPSKNRP